MPLAPPLLSISTGWPHIWESLSATMRVLMSVEAPGGNGTTKVTLPLGKACARAAPGTPDAARAANSGRRPSLVDPAHAFLPDSFVVAGSMAGGDSRRATCVPCAAPVSCAKRGRGVA